MISVKYSSAHFCNLLIAIIMGLFFLPAYADDNQHPKNLPFLGIADIHFDPFIACYQTKRRPCPLIQKLRHASANQWSSIFKKFDQTVPRYKQDSNYKLLISSLAQAKQVAIKKDAKFVIILGDSLAHHYRGYYKRYSRDRSLAGYKAFVKKTMVFLTNEFAKTFPHIAVYMVVGNNDSYHGDYYSKPYGSFFYDTASIWSRLIKTPSNRMTMRKIFPKGGYYAVAIPSHPKLKLIVLNTVLFSTSARGRQSAKAADAELAWLHQVLQSAKKNHQKVFLAMHIPPGIDVYATLKYRFRLIQLWKPQYTQQFENELKAFAPEISAIFAGHLHQDWFQVLTINNEKTVPVIGVPSISPVFGNNPGFKLYLYSSRTQRIEDVETYYYPMAKHSWSFEYGFHRIYQPHFVRATT